MVRDSFAAVKSKSFFAGAYIAYSAQVLFSTKLFTRESARLRLKNHYRLATNVFQVCGVNEHINPQCNKKLKPNELLNFMRQQSLTMVVMEVR
jgi:hypothetical protein